MGLFRAKGPKVEDSGFRGVRVRFVNLGLAGLRV